MKNKKRILVTGGVGFIGYHLAKSLVSRGYKVDIIDNLARGEIDSSFKELLNNKNIKFYKRDLTYDLKLKFLDYEYIFHLAAIVGVDNVINNPYKVLCLNTITLINVVNFAKKQKKLKRFFFISTSEVYSGALNNNLIKFPTNEKTILSLNDLSNRRGTYMLSKIYGEAISNFSGLPFTIFRPHNVFGERMGMSHVIPELTKKILNKKQKLFVNNSNHSRAFCYIGDAIKMIILSMNTKKTIGKTYNLGDPRNEIKIIDLAKNILKICKINKKIVKIKSNNNSPRRRLPSLKKYLADINFKFSSSYSKNLETTVNWYRKKLIS